MMTWLAAFSMPLLTLSFPTTRITPLCSLYVKQQDQRGQWRPTIDDVVRISWGKPAKQKGTGSRGIPHRLNQDERITFDLALNKGFVEVLVSKGSL
jgi:hypothetical protein